MAAWNECPPREELSRATIGALGEDATELIERFGRVAPGSLDQTTTLGNTAEGGGKPDHAESANDDEEVYDFLAPAQFADELGRLGGYRVLRVLGTGGMGVVFEAEDPQLKRRVALKAMKPGVAASVSARKRFLREAQTAAAVEHDHLVPIYQVGEDRGVPFIAMPLLRGETLAERLARGSGRSPTEPAGERGRGGEGETEGRSDGANRLLHSISRSLRLSVAPSLRLCRSPEASAAPRAGFNRRRCGGSGPAGGRGDRHQERQRKDRRRDRDRRRRQIQGRRCPHGHGFGGQSSSDTPWRRSVPVTECRGY